MRFYWHSYDDKDRRLGIMFVSRKYDAAYLDIYLWSRYLMISLWRWRE